MNTKIMSAVIVDDEPGAIQALEAGLKAYDDILVVDTQTNEQKARRSILRNKPDILFMDVEMPGISGIDLIKEMRPLMGDNTHVVFYTAYDKYLIDALRASAFDYLLKPYTPEELQTVIDRVREDSGNSGQAAAPSAPAAGSDDRFAVQTVDRLMLLRRQEILYFYYDESRCWVITLTNMEQHRLRRTTKAKDILAMNSSFVKVSSSCILNIDYLASVEHTTLRCVLFPPFNNVEIMASRRHYSEIKEALKFL